MRFFDYIHKKRLLLCAVLTLLTIGAVSFLLARPEEETLAESRFMLDTICTVTLYEWEGDGSAILNGAFDLCAEYEKRLSATVKGSDIDKINHSDGKPVSVTGETAALLQNALRYCALSGGQFDITIYPVKSLWDFNGEPPSLPDAATLREAAARVDYTLMTIDGTSVSLPKGMGVDLGAIAKGYIADRVKEYLTTEGVTSAIIDLGGNIYALGRRPDGELWRVGIRKPFSDEEADVVETADASVVTSGVYQRYFKTGERLYHHILRASDGMPCDSGLSSVTVIAESSEMCDALSTVCMLVGYEQSVKLLTQFPGTRAVFITDDYQLKYFDQ